MVQKRRLPDRRPYRVIARLPPSPNAHYPPGSQRDVDGLSAVENSFAQQYLIDLSPGDAAVRVGLEASEGRRMLAKRKIQDRIARERSNRAGRTKIYADEVLRRWWLLATADVRELVQIRRICCRYCYGLDHRYQFTKNELEKKQIEHRTKMLLLKEENRYPFDDLGGDGYDSRKQAVFDCPECWGNGVVDVYFEDTANYSPAAVALFDGVKVGHDGTLEIKLRDRTEALNKVAGFLGLIVRRRTLTTIDPGQLTDDQLDHVIKEFEEKFQHLLPTDEALIEEAAMLDNEDEDENLEEDND